MQKEFSIIGNIIKALRVCYGMKQSELAKKIGMSQTNLSNVESGRTAVTVQVLLKIHDVLGCKLADFFVDIDNDVEEAAKEEQSANVMFKNYYNKVLLFFVIRNAYNNVPKTTIMWL